MWRYSLLRIVGVVWVLVALLFAIIQTAQKNIPIAVLAWLLVAAGLWVAVLGDKGIDRVKAETLKAKAEAAQQFSGHLLEIGPKWVWLLLGDVLIPLIVFSLGTWASAKMQAASLWLVAVTVIGVVSLVGIWVRLMRLTLLALSHGSLVKFDPMGLHIAGRGCIPWTAVRGIDLRADVVRSTTHHTLVLALDHAFIMGGGPVRNIFRFFGGAIAIEPGKDILNIPCALLRVDPLVMVQAARVIGDRHGAKRLKNWHYTQPIEIALQEEVAAARVREADGRLQHLLDQMQRMDKAGEPDADKLKKLDQEVAAAFGESQAALAARVQLFEVEGKRLKKQARTAMWGVVAGVIFGLGAILMKVFLVVGR